MQGFRAPPQIHSVQEVVGGNTQSAWLQEGRTQKTLLPTPCQSQLRSTPAIIRKATLNDIWSLYKLYKIVAQVNRGNLTQEKDEITVKYISKVLNKGLERGLVLVFDQKNQIIGYLKAFTSPFRCLAHVLTNATMMVHPEWQGKGYGSQLIDAYLSEIKSIAVAIEFRTQPEGHTP
jgi:GNAT superfamily N-acetyltransferase